MSAGRAMPLLKVYFRTYETADAPVAIACGSRGLRVRFLDVLGIEDAERHDSWVQGARAIREI